MPSPLFERCIMPKKTSVKPKTATIRASKENARKAKKLVAALTAGKQLNEKETWFLNEFIDRTIGRLPTEEAIARNIAKQKSRD